MSIPQGETVRHRSKGYVGKVLGHTNLLHLMEEKGDTVGYRVLSGSKVHVASEKNLEVLPHYAAVLNHKARLEAGGIPYHGIRKRDPGSAHQRHRSSHCWACHHRVDSKIDIECRTCGWIICSCGACGCGFVPKAPRR